MRAKFVRNDNDGLFYILKEDGSSYVAEILQGNVLKIREQLTELDNQTEFKLVPFPNVTDGTLTFVLKEILPEIKIKHKSLNYDNSGGSAGISGIDVELNGTIVVSKAKKIDFIGDASQVQAESATIAKIIFIPSLTTAARLALTPTTPLIVQDTDLDMYFKWSTVSSSWNPF